MNRDQKAAVIEEIAGEIQESEAVFAVDYRGISVPQAAALRGKLREVDASFRVVKNSLTERAADRAGAEALKALLEGPTALAFVRGDAAQAAKALSDAARATQVLDFKGGMLNGSTLSADDIRALSRLPTREVLYAQLVGTVASPITGLVRGLNALIAGLAVQLQAIADQGLVTGTVPAATEAPTAEPAAPDSEAAAPESAAPEPEAPGPEASEPEPAADADPDAGPASQPDQTETPGEAEDPDAAPASEPDPNIAEDKE